MSTVTRVRYRTSVHGVPYKRVAEILRQARDLMNNGGRHWVKGEEKIDVAHVNPKSHFVDSFHEEPIGEYAFCSIGAVKEICGGNYNEEYEAALFELIKVMDPDSIKYAEENYYDDYQNNWDFYSEKELILNDIPKPSQENLLGNIDLSDTITAINDDEATIWEDVRDWFTTAAKRAMAKR